MKTVYDLSREQLNELKQAYVCQLYEDSDVLESPSYGELVDSEQIPDSVIFEHYDGVSFVDDDFFCSVRGG
jgi:hypothetical protein